MGLEDFCPTGPGQDFSRDCIQLSYNILRGVKSQVGNQEWRDMLGIFISLNSSHLGYQMLHYFYGL